MARDTFGPGRQLRIARKNRVVPRRPLDCGGELRAEMTPFEIAEREARILAHAARIQSDPRYREPTEAERANGNTPKLTNMQVVEIRTLLSGGVNCHELGRRYGVSAKTISAISHGRRYTWVGNDGTGVRRGRQRASGMRDDRGEEITRLRGRGESWKRIADRYGAQCENLRRQYGKWVSGRQRAAGGS